MPRGKKNPPPSETAAAAAPKAGKTVATPGKSGKLAVAREFAAKVLKKPSADWRVVLDYDQLKKPLPHIPTGSLVIDYLIGGQPNAFGVRPCPGLPRARFAQLWGHESAGKTTLALRAAAATCAAGGTVLYVDWENDIVPDYAAALGVPITDSDRFELVQPETLEDGIKLATVYAHAGVDLIIFDSVGAPATARTAARDMSEVAEQGKVGELQQIWSTELANLKRVINKSKTAILGISQIRAKIATTGGGHGPTTQPQGGNAWKFYSSVRIELRRVKQESTNLYNALTHKKDEQVVGGVISAKMIKCKLSRSQGNEALFYIRWGEGIDDVRSVMEVAIAHGVIKKGGAWLSWESPDGKEIKCQGVSQFRDVLKAHPEYVDRLYDDVVPYLGQTHVAEGDLEEIDAATLLAEDAEELQEGEDKSDPEAAEDEEAGSGE